MSEMTPEDVNIERMINERIKPMKEEIKELRRQVEGLKSAVNSLIVDLSQIYSKDK